MEKQTPEIRYRPLWRVPGVYFGVGWVALEVIDQLVGQLILPQWVYRLALTLLLVGFPVVVATTLLQGKARPEGEAKGNILKRIFSWRHTTIAGVIAFALWGGVAATWIYFGQPGLEADDARVKTIAILPLWNISKDPAQDYFVDGMTEQLRTELVKVGALSVTASTSTMLYKKTEKPLRESTRELNVDYLVGGSVMWTDDQVRISVQLTGAQDEEQLWAESYEGNTSDVLLLQRNVARRIVREIQVWVSPEERRRLKRTRKIDPEALDSYLKGLHLADNLFTQDNFRRSIGYFHQALNIEPGYAQAHAGLAYAYALVGAFGVLPPGEAFSLAKAASLRALELNEDLASAHTVLGQVRAFYDWDWTAADREFRRAVELDPGFAHFYYGIYLSAVGRHDEAIAEMQRARRLNPLSPMINIDVGWAFYFGREYDQAIEQLQTTQVLFPAEWDTYHHLGMAQIQKGALREAVLTLERGASLATTQNPMMQGMLGYAYAIAGKKVAALTIAKELEQARSERYVQPYLIAIIYAGLGDEARAFHWLETGLDERDWWLPFIGIEPAFDSLRQHPRFISLLHRMNLHQ